MFSDNQVKENYFEMLQKLKTLEQQVENKANQLELAKSSFLKNIYHEVRTPLNGIVGFTNLVAQHSPMTPQEQEEYIYLINSSSKDFLTVMDDIIQASLLEVGMVKLSTESFSLKSFMDEIHDYGSTRKHVLKKNNLAVLNSTSSITGNIDISCDQYHLAIVLKQLIDNAIKYTSRGVVEYGCCMKKSHIEFFVKDSGQGDLAGKEDFLFNRFTKLDISDSARNGLGLGLSNCKYLVQLMNGEIWYDSVAGKGTTFFFSVPLSDLLTEKKLKKESNHKQNFINESINLPV